MNATVSIVIPTHNRRELLLRTLRSALAQQAIDFEIIVVDDGSGDGTTEAIRALADSRVTLLRNDRRVRVAAARNMGASAAAGSWIALLDDDDLWAPDKSARQLLALEQTGAAWTYAGVVEIDDHGLLLGGEPPPSPDHLLEHLPGGNLMPAGCSNVLISRDLLLETGGFDTQLRHLADWDLWLRLARSGAPACVNMPLVAYRIHAGQASLDPHGMIAEGRIIQARYGADLNSIRRWLAWSHLRRRERLLAARTYAHAALAGDLTSLARAAVALLHPNPTGFRCGAAPPLEWVRSAESWLRPFADK